MNVTILEDRPMLMREAIKKMEDMGIHTKNIICYKNKNNQGDESESNIKNMCDNLNVDLFYVDNDSFNSVLDRFYRDENMIFLFDMDLLGDFSHHFLLRINVMYALEKQEKEQKKEGGKERIWFYTTGPIDAVEQINKYFPDRRIPVVRFNAKEEITVLDYEFIRKELLG